MRLSIRDPQILLTQIIRIVQKLREHGYGDDYDNMTWDERNDFALLREVRQSRPLTDRSMCILVSFSEYISLIALCSLEEHTGSYI